MFTDGFISKDGHILLEESCRSENLLDLSVEIENFSSKLDAIKNTSIIGFVGKFGTGKSNFLNQIKEKYSEDTKWFDFDAWKYPERSNLWENFVLEIARQVNQKNFDEALKKMDGKVNNDKKTLFNTIGDIPGLAVIKNFNHFLDTSPAKRTFEVQNILSSLFEKITETDIYIVVEDIDRSGDAGIYFLETLNHFIKNVQIEKRIFIIVPIGQDNFEEEKIKSSYLKCLDYSHQFSLKSVKLNDFIKKVFINEITSNQVLVGQITSFLEGIFKEFGDQITMRLLKNILRNANMEYIKLLNRHGEGVDWRLSILFEVAKHIVAKNRDGNTFIKYWKDINKIGSSDSIFSALCLCILRENPQLNERELTDIYREEVTAGGRVTIPWSIDYKIPLKFVSLNYKELQVKDSILYHVDQFSREKSYFGILQDYLD